MRHEDVRRAFGRFTPRVSPLYGSTLTIDFGVGMVFVPAANADAANTDAGNALANNILIFNHFSVVESTFEQVAIVKQSAYSIATHVAFWTAVAQQDPAVRIATIEYLLDLGHALELDPQFVHMCPLKTAETPIGAACITTHDWGPAERTRPESNTLFVHKVHTSEDAASESTDVAWFANVFGSADMDMVRRR